MALTINTNIASLNAQRNLSKSQNDLSKSMQRLSSGLRINSAKDDAAGLAISDRMTSQIRGLNQAARNANDGISMAQTAEGALQESTNILQRLRELAVQAANDTNSDTDRASLNEEVIHLQAELDRIAVTTEFNGRKVIDGTMIDATFQVGANAGINQTITFSIESGKAADLSYVGTVIDAPNDTPVLGTNVTGDPIAAGTLSVNGNDVGDVLGNNASLAAAINAANANGDPTVADIATPVNVQTFEFSTVSLIAPTTTLTAVEAVAGDAGTPAVSELQTLDLANVSLGAGKDLRFTIGTESIVFTNGTGNTLTGAALVTEIADTLQTSAVGATGGDYIFSANTIPTTLNITQAPGNESNVNNTLTAGIVGPSGETTQVGAKIVPAVAEAQIIDFSGVRLANGGTITLNIDGNTTVSYTAGALANSATIIAGLVGTPTINGVNYALVAGPNNTLTISQTEVAVPPTTYKPIADVTASGTGIMTPDTIQSRAGRAGVAEVQHLNFLATKVAAGETLTFAIDGRNVDYTNNTLGELTGAGLVADIATTLNTIADIGNGSSYIFSTGAPTTTLDITQAAGSEKTIAAITTSNDTVANGEPAGTPGAGISAIAEAQALNLGTTSLASGATLTLDFGGAETIIYTNNTGSMQFGADLATAMADYFGAGADYSVGATAGEWIFAAAGTTLNMVQAAGSEKPAAEVIATGQTGPTAVEVTSGVARIAPGTAEIQKIDLSQTTVLDGDSLAITIEGFEFTWVNNTANTNLSGEALIDQIITDFTAGDYDVVDGTRYTPTKGAPVTDLIFTQSVVGPIGELKPIAPITTSGVVGPTAAERIAGGVQVAAIPEAQVLNLSALTLRDGESLTFDLGSENITYTNASGVDQTGASLSLAIALEIGTTTAAGGYTFAQDTIPTSLTITQNVGNESDISAITATTSPQTVGTYILDIDGTAVDIGALTGPSVTAAEVADAITDTVSGFTAELNADGAVVITKTDGTAFTMSETIDVDGPGTMAVAATTAGLKEIGTVASTFNGMIQLQGDADIIFEGTALKAAGLDTTGNATTTIDQVNVLTRADAWVAIASVDAALNDIDSIRGGLGAVQNRFESTIANLNSVSENLSAARSRIQDADIAMETSAMTKSNILQQAGVSILAQANQTPQLALQLLQG